MRRMIVVFLGGGAGACGRAALAGWLAPWGGPLPAAILAINLAGAAILGIVFVLADEADLLHPETRAFLAVGVLGGFTTFSTMAWGGDVLIAGGETAVSLMYACASVVGGFIAAAAGILGGRQLVALGARFSKRHVMALDRSERLPLQIEGHDEG